MGKTVGDRIREKRTAAGMTQEELAKAIGTTKQNIYKYETGIITNIPINRLEDIARVLAVSPAYLAGWEQTVSQELSSLIDKASPAQLAQIQAFVEFLRSRPEE